MSTNLLRTERRYSGRAKGTGRSLTAVHTSIFHPLERSELGFAKTHRSAQLSPLKLQSKQGIKKHEITPYGVQKLGSKP
jgi:hypothetical protein